MKQLRELLLTHHTEWVDWCNVCGQIQDVVNTSVSSGGVFESPQVEPRDTKELQDSERGFKAAVLLM